MGLKNEIADLRLRIDKMENSKDKSRLQKSIYWFNRIAIFCIVIGFGFLLFGFYQYLFGCSLTLNELGDFWGGSVGSFWALAGLFYIYVAFLGQKQQLLLQQIELKYSQLDLMYARKELKGQKKQMIQQNLTLGLQRFENTFFQMLGLFQDGISNLDLAPNVHVKGRVAINQIYQQVKSRIIEQVHHHADKSSILIYEETFQTHQSSFGHYFRLLFQLILVVHENTELKDKMKYFGIVQAHLSADELFLLFYHGLSRNGEPKLKSLIEQYSFFQNLPIDFLFDRSHINDYAKSAFGSNPDFK